MVFLAFPSLGGFVFFFLWSCPEFLDSFPPSLSLFFLFLKSYLMPNVLIVLCSFARDPHKTGVGYYCTPSVHQQLAWSLGTFNMLNFADGRLPSLREEPYFVP